MRQVRLAKRWFHIIKREPDRLDEALEWCIQEVEEGFRLTAGISGNLESTLKNNAGLVSYYDGIHTDLDMILAYYERLMRQVKASKLREWSDNPPTHSRLSVQELKLLIDNTEEVILLSDIVEEIKYVYKQYGSLLKSLDARGYDLTNITKLRVANLQEVEL